jgi:hypothetical protein
MSRFAERARGVLGLCTPVRRSRPAWPDLAAWHPRHRDTAGGVWAVRPPCGYGTWSLYGPGAAIDPVTRFLVEDPAARHPATSEYGGDSDRTTLADVRWWMRPWIERVSGGRVVEMVEGWSEPYGEHREWQEYVIYAAVACRVGAQRQGSGPDSP